MLHYGHVDQTVHGWRASCQCGWVGPLRIAESTAQNDARRHEMHARGRGDYA
jgi:hypothetical protein